MFLLLFFKEKDQAQWHDVTIRNLFSIIRWDGNAWKFVLKVMVATPSQGRSFSIISVTEQELSTKCFLIVVMC